MNSFYYWWSSMYYFMSFVFRMIIEKSMTKDNY